MLAFVLICLFVCAYLLLSVSEFCVWSSLSGFVPSVCRAHEVQDMWLIEFLCLGTLV